ncbi:hypothetical protein OIU85_018140 [Salix viminalis]|uniref:Uncharacterized protein n=1 Tax=Salix viminalis TaxID=40686 RepID=A0A9Q0UTN3_SALVM|nr:hypothetical protein OIU85_018140 [Salix viminalis]
MIVEDSSMVQADTFAPITPSDSTPPTQHQQGIILDDTDKDNYQPKAKKTLTFTNTPSENLHLKQKAIIIDEEDEPPTKRQKKQSFSTIRGSFAHQTFSISYADFFLLLLFRFFYV